MDAIGYLKRNKKQIQRSSLENWMDLEIEQIIEMFIQVIRMTIDRNEDEEGTNQFYDKWLRSLRPEHEGFYRQWLIRAFDGDMSFVYASNALIRSLNRDLPRKDGGETVSLKSKTIWEYYLKVRERENLNGLKEEIRHLLPDIDERLQFLSFAIMQQKKDYSMHNQYDDKIILLEELLEESNKKIEERSSKAVMKREKSKNIQLAKYDNGHAYVRLFQEPDCEFKAEQVKVVLDEIGLTKSGRLMDSFTIQPTTGIKNSKDVQPVNKNTLGYVLAALKDPENEICNINYIYGSGTHLATVFFKEFGLTVGEYSSAGGVTMRNIRKALENDNRKNHFVYKDFTRRYKEKLKELK